MKTNQKCILIMLSLIVFISLACSLPSFLGDRIRDLLDTQITETIEQETEEDVEQITTPENAEEIIEQAEETAQQLITTITGNDTSMIDSYRTSFQFSAEGISETGINFSQSVEMQEEMNRSQSLYHNKIQAIGTGIDVLEGDQDIYIQGDKTYLYNLENPVYPCVMVGGGMDSIDEMGFLHPEDFFESIDTDELLEQGVLINGVLADHYSVLHTGMEMEDTVSENGEIWIAQDGGFIVRYIGSAEGSLRTGESMGEGNITWEYNLYDVDQVAVIDFPVECRDQQETVEDIPIPDNVMNKEIIAGIITYETPNSPEQLGDFYREQLPSHGWRITEDSVVATLVMMSAEKDGQSLQIMITPGGTGGSSIIITTIPLQ